MNSRGCKFVVSRMVSKRLAEKMSNKYDLDPGTQVLYPAFWEIRGDGELYRKP